MNIGRRLLIDKSTNRILHDFGEMSGDVLPRPDVNNLVMIDLEYGKYADEFLRLKDGLNSITVTDVENKFLEFDLNPSTLTPEQQIEELQNQLMIAQGVI
ncbi:hypothetical protein N4T77_02615 [Clostridium sp. CX1]|uniref:hypothetical protein n=1 Tax=Clostridium sp. CX1 TaxID=2978346 RepID=UPI0021BE56EE|nr:hypothetical protein [Clostridium sp. CX1]MCT8975483.1 hypothetical protein [Clostridium sp. CX1]